MANPHTHTEAESLHLQPRSVFPKPGKAPIAATATDRILEDLVHLAAEICQAPIAWISLTEGNQVKIVSKIGFDEKDTPCDSAFCAQTLLQDNLFVVSDLLQDPRFEKNSPVCKKHQVHFYAGVPLLVSGKPPIGAISILDYVPRNLTNEQKDALSRLGRQASLSLENQKLLQGIQEQFSFVMQATKGGLWDWNLTEDTVHFSLQWKSLLGFEEGEIGTSINEWWQRIHPMDFNRVRKEISLHLEGLVPYFECEYRMLHKYGTYRWVINRAQAIRNAAGRVERLIGFLSDITHHKEAERQLMHDAFHNLLTGLPNRTYFMDRLAQSTTTLRRQGKEFAILFLDLDRFKVVNDSLGHRTGDQLLVATGRRLSACVRPQDTVAHFGGDEFVILLDGIEARQEITKIADRIQEEIAKPFQLSGQEVFVSLSVGIVLGSAGDGKIEHLVRDAETAMHRAKTLGKGRYEIFNPAMHSRAVTLLELESELRNAMKKGELQVFYQPIFSLPERKIIRSEALLRWNHPRLGFISPADFIPLAEETGLILSIGEWILRRACIQNMAWQMLGNPDLQIAINFSALQFEQQTLPKMLATVLQETQMNPNTLEIEITESTAMKNIDSSISLMKEIRSLGVQITIDDFGTGYSSLGSLQHFPIQTLKIHESFLPEIPENKHDAAITAAIIGMAHSLGLKVVGEGVERMEQLEFLREQACDQVQGYYLGGPMNQEDFTKLLRSACMEGTHPVNKM